MRSLNQCPENFDQNVAVCGRGALQKKISLLWHQKQNPGKNCSLWTATGGGGKLQKKISLFWHQKQNPAKFFVVCGLPLGTGG